MFRIGIRMNGHTTNVVQKINNADVRDVLDRKALQTFAQAVTEEVKLQADIGNFEPLTPQTIATKRLRGSPTPSKPWFERPFLVDNLFLRPVVRFYKSGSVTVSIPTSNQPHPRTKLALNSIFGILDEKRPITAPVFEDLQTGRNPLVTDLQQTIKENMEKMFQ
jgi:hypothetical protein